MQLIARHRVAWSVRLSICHSRELGKRLNRSRFEMPFGTETNWTQVTSIKWIPYDVIKVGVGGSTCQQAKRELARSRHVHNRIAPKLAQVFWAPRLQAQGTRPRERKGTWCGHVVKKTASMQPFAKLL